MFEMVRQTIELLQLWTTTCKHGGTNNWYLLQEMNVRTRDSNILVCPAGYYSTINEEFQQHKLKIKKENTVTRTSVECW